MAAGTPASSLLSDPPSHLEGFGVAGIAGRGKQGSFILHNAFGQTAPERCGGGGCQARNAHTCTWEGSFEFLLFGGVPGAWPLAMGGSLEARALGRSTPPRPPSQAATRGEMAHNGFLTFPRRAFLSSLPPSHLQFPPLPLLHPSGRKKYLGGQTSSGAFRHRMDRRVHKARPFYSIGLRFAHSFS